jgi:hypothetical protein
VSRKAEYRMFLRSPFWIDLSFRKRQLVGRCEQLVRRIAAGRLLRERDEAFLRHAEAEYPGTPTDQAMLWQVRTVREMETFMRKA